MKKPLSMIGLAAITLLLTLSIITEALAIDVYHFLVQYKNGRIVEKITTYSEENYKNYYEGYVANVVLLNKKEYSLQRFIQTFGQKNYRRFMTGHFGLGLEEQIIFHRNAGGLDVDPLALPPPDKKSKALAKKFDRILHGDHQAGDTNQLDKSTLPNPAPLPAQGDDPDSLANWPLQGEGVDLPVDLHPESPKESDEKESYAAKIDVYRFLVEYINGRTVEKASTQLPEEYHKHYKGYVRKVAPLGKETYTVREFKETFGEKNYNLLIQGLFGKDDTDIVMENRIKRGIAPHPSVLPAPSKKSNKLAKKLIENQ
ncbi:MAG: hypothetical protein ISS63_07610 [Desulfobacteraceae bacterium]|nr:hypothetical protein [Desulfobacteraceae bacterium]